MRKLFILLGLLPALSACTPSPEEAKKKLAAQNIAVDDKALLAKTKDAAGEKTANLLVQAGVDPNARQANGMTALMSAVYNGQRDTAALLIEKGARVNDSAKGFTALRLAVERNDKEMVRLLLRHGADPNLRPDGAPSALEKATMQADGGEIATMLKKVAR
jgi:uncharacterized protein